jgi:hypothetical protein
MQCIERRILMLSSIQSKAKTIRYRDAFIIGMVIVETALVLMALVPPQLWTRLLPQMPNAGLDGPFPPFIAPIITALLYLLPALVGFLSSSWQKALLYATLPAWIGLGIFIIAATSRVGIFYLISADHVTANIGVLELFALLGGLGWLVRHIVKIG